MNQTWHIAIRSTKQNFFQIVFRTVEGDCLLSGEPRASRELALKDAANLRRCVSEDGCYAMARDASGRFYFHFIGDAGETIGVSRCYLTPEGLGNAIATLKAGAPKAEVIHLD